MVEVAQRNGEQGGEEAEVGVTEGGEVGKTGAGEGEGVDGRNREEVVEAGTVAVVGIQEVVVVGVAGLMVAGVEVVVIGVDREDGQRRGMIGGGREEIGKTTDGLEVNKMIGRVRAGQDGEIEVGGEGTMRAMTGGADPLTGRDQVNGDRHQVNTVAVEEVLQNVGSLPEEALRGPGLLPGEVEGRVEGGKKEGGGRTEGGGEMRTRRTTTCWRAATLCPPTMGTRRGGGRSC